MCANRSVCVTLDNLLGNVKTEFVTSQKNINATDCIGIGIMCIRAIWVQEGGQRGLSLQATAQQDGFYKHMDDTVFSSSPVNKELVTSPAHSFSPAWSYVPHADFQTLTCKNSLWKYLSFRLFLREAGKGEFNSESVIVTPYYPFI